MELGSTVGWGFGGAVGLFRLKPLCTPSPEERCCIVALAVASFCPSASSKGENKPRPLPVSSLNTYRLIARKSSTRRSPLAALARLIVHARALYIIGIRQLMLVWKIPSHKRLWFPASQGPPQSVTR